MQHLKQLKAVFLWPYTENVAMREKIVSDQDEETELKSYNRHMKWLDDSKKSFTEWYDKHCIASTAKEDKHVIQLHILGMRVQRCTLSGYMEVVHNESMVSLAAWLFPGSTDAGGAIL